MNSWPTQQRHWSSVCGDQIKIHAPFQRESSSPRHYVHLLGGETPVCVHKKWGSFLALLQALLPWNRQFSAHCMSCCFQSWQELKFCRAGVGLWNRNSESRGKERKFSAQTHRRSTPLPMPDVSCAPSGHRRQEGAPVFPLNSMTYDQHCWCLDRTEQYTKVFVPRMEAGTSQHVYCCWIWGCSAPLSNPAILSCISHLRSLLFPRPWANLALLKSAHSFAEMRSNIGTVASVLFMIIQVHMHTSVCLSVFICALLFA